MQPTIPPTLQQGPFLTELERGQQWAPHPLWEKRGDHSLCLDHWANIVFLFLQRLARPDRLISSGNGPLHWTLAFNWPCWESLNHCLWHQAPHDTIRGQAERHLSWDMKPQWHPKPRASSPKPLHSRLELWQSRKTQRRRLELGVFVEQLERQSVWRLDDTHLPDHHGGRASVPGRGVVLWLGCVL